MKILVAIASYGTKNRHHLECLLAEYSGMAFDIDIVVLSEAPKNLDPGIEVRVGLSIPNPYSLPFAHRALFAERADQYDLFIYTEDDTLITERNIHAFMQASEQVASNELPGFLRAESAADGSLIFECMHSAYRWLPGSVCHRQGVRFAEFSNAHAACTLLTRDQLGLAIKSGGFVVEPHEGRYRVLETAATDAYTQCGFRKLIRIEGLRDFVVLHLANKYVGQWGMREADVELQLQAMCDIESQVGSTGSLLLPESPVPGGKWWKDLYATEDFAVKSLVPDHSRNILVIGVGNGEAEAQLLSSDRRVTVMPIDPIFARCCEARNLVVLGGGFDDPGLQAMSFDCVILPNVLQLVNNPEELLQRVSGLLSPGGSVVCSIPSLPDKSRPNRLRRKTPAVFTATKALYWRHRMEFRARRWFARASYRVDPIMVSGFDSSTRSGLRKLGAAPQLSFRLVPQTAN